jgi:glucokinase
MFNHAAAIGVDIGSNSLKIAVVKINGEIIDSDSIVLERNLSRDNLIKLLISTVRDVRLKVAEKGINPICIGVAAKGFIDHRTGTILGPDQGIKGWNNLPLASIINEGTGLPVFVGNDANMMTIAEQKFGSANGYKNIIFVALRTGIGGGIIIDGKLYRGVNNAGGEIGQMIIDYNGPKSNLGIRGSFEYMASASAVVRRYYEETGEQNSSGVSLSCKEIFELSYKNSPAAIRVINENAGIVGIGLANLITIFAPEIIILGGGMSQANDNYISMIRKSAFENSLENCRAEVKIERAGLGSSASLMGSAYYALIKLAGKSI